MKVLIIGLGSIGRKHIKVLREINPASEIFALRSKNPAPNEDNIWNIYSYSEIPEDIDFFVIATPTAFHQTVIQHLIPFGKPLFIEKPVLDSINETGY